MSGRETTGWFAPETDADLAEQAAERALLEAAEGRENPCCDDGPAGHTEQQHHDASDCWADACPLCPAGRENPPRCGCFCHEPGAASPFPGHPDGCPCDRPTTCPALIGPVWKLDGETCGCRKPANHDLREGHDCPCGSWWAGPFDGAPSRQADTP